MSYNLNTFQGLIIALQQFWDKQGCVLLQPFDLEVGAGTFHPDTFLRAIGPEPWNAAHVQASRRPTDGRYGEHPNRNQHFYQYQVVLKPSPLNIQEIYLDSLRVIGINPLEHDIRFVEDNWESPTLGASGIGWEVWLDGMEITQFTYFQQVGGMECKPVMGEIAYGIERLAMIVQGVTRIQDLVWTKSNAQERNEAMNNASKITYGDIFLQNEVEMTRYNFEKANVSTLFKLFDLYESECNQLIGDSLPLPAYEMVLKASHIFNLLDARRAISVSERQRFILRVRSLARQVAELYYQEREKTGFPIKDINTFNASNTANASNNANVSNGASNAISLDKTKADNNQNKGLQSTHKDLLIEIGVEELPPKNLETLSKAFADEISKGLNSKNLAFTDIKTFITPRRLAVIVNNLATTQPPQTIVKRGPAKSAAFDANGKPTPQALGFAKACNTNFENLTFQETDKGPCLVFEHTQPGLSTESLIPKMVSEALQQLPIAKRMRWGDRAEHFIRPVHWIVLLFGESVIDAELFGIPSGNTTHGHRFHHPNAIALTSPSDYTTALSTQGKVIADFEKRKNEIQQQLTYLATREQGQAFIDPELLDQVTGLVEWPVVLLGQFEKSFLDLPQEVLMTSMKVHQKCFPIFDKNGKLLNKFLIVSNLESIAPNSVIKGNERVMDARLRDAAFYYRIDQDLSLEQRRQDLKQVVFQHGLGSLWDKGNRIDQLSRLIAETITVNPKDCTRAAVLCKTDLTTQMVGEFPELQGIIGRCYALLNGEPQAVATAIEEHYLPRFANDELPKSTLGSVIALADRIDTLVGIFGQGKRPTGDKDPFGLRRQALGILRIIIEQKLNLDLQALFVAAKEFYGEHLTTESEVVRPLLDFCFERLRVWYQDQGVPTRVFDAVIVKWPTKPLDFDHRLHAVTEFLKLPEAESLSAANKRVRNILNKTDVAISSDTLFDEALLQEDAEKNLSPLILKKEAEIKPLIAAWKYKEALQSLASLKTPIDQFFDTVMVMVEDPKLRNNRLKLLNRLRALFLEIADISLL